MDDSGILAQLPSYIGRYRVVDTIGRGGFATVYLAEDPALDITVAIKMLSDDNAARGDVRERFINEARKMRELAGPGLVAVHDIAEQDNKPYFVMEHCRGGDLEERLESLIRPINLEEAQGLALALTTATTVVHKRNVVHRDLKPSNFLIRHTPTQNQPIVGELLANDEELVIADFGLAKALDLKSSRITLGGGTPGFGAPEQFRCDPNIDIQADVYGLSAILVSALSGETPKAVFTSKDQAFTPQALSTTGSLRTALVRGLEFDPADRQTDAMEWHEDLSRTIVDSSLPSGLGQARIVSRRSMLKTSSVALLGFSGVTAFVLSPIRFPGQRILGPSEGATGDEAVFTIGSVEDLTWTVDGQQQSRGRTISISPDTAGEYAIRATSPLRSTTHLYRAVQRSTEMRISGSGYAPIGQMTRYSADGAESNKYTWAVSGQVSTGRTVEIQPDTVGPIRIQLSNENDDVIIRTITAIDLQA